MTNKFASKTFAPTVQSGGGDYPEVDWEALNNHVAEAVQEATGCEQGTPAGVVGIISGLVDFGRHQDPERIEPMDEGDAKTKEWKQRVVDKKKATIDESGNFHYQAPPCQEVGFYVDFPSITVDKGQFFGDSKPAPYRVLLGGVFQSRPAQVTKVQGYPNDNRVWVFGEKNRATKLAKAAKIKNMKDGFAQERLLELIGKPIQFSLEVFVNDAGYLQEKATQPAPLMAGIPVPEYDEGLLFYVGLNEDNDPTSLKYLTKPVKEYMKEALDFEGSKVQGQLDAAESASKAQKEGSSGEAGQSPKEGVKVEKKAPKPTYNEPPTDFDDDIPF